MPEGQILSCVDFRSITQMSQEDAMRTILDSFPTFGLQATQMGRARSLVQRILHQRAAGDRVFLAYTSNLVSSGLREVFVHLAKESLVDGIISTAGGIEEDVIKCLGHTHVAKFQMDDRALRLKGINRTGNLLVPNDNYCLFEDFFLPVLASLHDQQRALRWEGMTTPSEIIHAMGAALEKCSPSHCEESLVYWCYRHAIPMFSPALTDGSMGDMIYFYNFSKKGLVVDPVKDALTLRSLAGTRNSCITLGGGLPKHHLLSNIRMQRVVMVTTGTEADGCTSACCLPDDRACNLLSRECEIVRVHADATIVLPLLLCPIAVAEGMLPIGTKT